MLKKIVQVFGGDPSKRELEKLSEVVEIINSLENQYEAFTDQQLSATTGEFRQRLSAGETLDEILPEAFAVVREASKRTIGLRHYDVQMIGGIALHQGTIAEMKTGEGKTLVATLPLYLNALTGKGAHLVTVNDYLARRDARWMAPIYDMLGLKVGVLQMGGRAEQSKFAYLVDLEKTSPHEDQNQLELVPRSAAYAADITYGTNNEFGFDYLRDNMVMQLGAKVQREHHYAIIDEVDNVLIDEARTPLIISGPSHEDTESYIQMAQLVKHLKPEDFEINERDRTVTLTEIGEVHVEQLLGKSLRDPDRPEDITPEQARLYGHLEQAMRAHHLFHRNKDYLVQAGKVIIVDEFTGRLMPGRRWSDGLHQAVEAKEGAKVQAENVTYATVTIQNYFRMYQKLAGMTGTAVTEAEEFDKIYSLNVLAIPTNLEYEALDPRSKLNIGLDRDSYGYKFQYYWNADDLERTPIFWRRKDYPDVIYRSLDAKLRAITKEVIKYHTIGRPILLGTTSVELSDRIAERLKAEPIRRLVQTILIRENWLQANDRTDDGRLIEELVDLNQPLDELRMPDLRKLARELDMSLDPEHPDSVQQLLSYLDLPRNDKTESRLKEVLRGGIPHQVLNARKHTEESQIIAGAGAFGAVTIATNMAGRGVDIKLGGEIAEEIISVVSRVLRKAGYDNPYEMTLQQQKDALEEIDLTEYGIYESEIKYFKEFIQDMDRVRELGGLHVIGSERHESRRIDNQLRGRSARQGDPGSSRFYLSLEDDLMRLFGGQQVDSLMQRLKVDDAVPIEANIVGKIIEQSQSRVEGANFDTRKHLLEYDDVLNLQREKIYAQRDRIFIKYDLTDDVVEMLESEVRLRVPEALNSEEDAWKLLAWLDQIQPTMVLNDDIYPSYPLKLLAENLIQKGFLSQDRQAMRTSLVNLAKSALDAEEAHLHRSVDILLEQSVTTYETQLADRLDALDTFIEGIQLEEDSDALDAAVFENRLLTVLRLPVKFTRNQIKEFVDDPENAQTTIREIVEKSLVLFTFIRLFGAVERRLEEPLDVRPTDLAGCDWDVLAARLHESLRLCFQKRKDRLIGAKGDGLIWKDLEPFFASREDEEIKETDTYQAIHLMTQGTRSLFDSRTHKRVTHRTTRLNYIFHAAEVFDWDVIEDACYQILKHMETIRLAVQEYIGHAEIQRSEATKLTQMDPAILAHLEEGIGAVALKEISGKSINQLSEPQKNLVADAIGLHIITSMYRQLLLNIITELWVDYLTQMEALRVSIGLEAYAQRDPLVQYKNRAFEMFQVLLKNMRAGVVNRMFLFRPREEASIKSVREPVLEPQIPQKETAPQKNTSKRSRRRRSR